MEKHIWTKGDMAMCEYINDERTCGKILSVNLENETANVLLYIQSKKLKKTSTEPMTLSFDKLSVPEFIKDMKEEEDYEKIEEI